MSTLIMIGNINQHTFANAILAANEKSKELFEGNALDKIHVFHTPESIIKLNNNLDAKDGWKKFLEKNLIDYEKFIHRTIRIDTSSQDEDSLEKFANDIEEIMDKNNKVIIDLSNGAIFHRNLLSIISYILNIKHQYMIDITTLSKLTDKRGFLDINILKQTYFQVPESHKLDSLAYLDLSEMKRYKFKIKELGKKFENISPQTADINFFEENLSHSIEFKLKGDKTRNNTLYRISSASVASSAEELINLILEKKGNNNHHSNPFGVKLNTLLEILKKEDRDIDLEFLEEFNKFILFLRNKTTHKNSQNFLSDVEKFKAELSIFMSLEFIEFYTDIVYPSMERLTFENAREVIDYPKEPLIDEEYYFGIDGDSTGACLEDLLVEEKKDELKKISQNISDALKIMGNYIKNVSKDNEIIFQTGDDMLVRGRLSFDDLVKIKQIYKNKTEILTCSIGFGKTSKDAYMALKLAKANPQKNMIKGIYLKN
jgi:hypothetical protein